MQEEYERTVKYKKGSGNVGGVEQLNIKKDPGMQEEYERMIKCKNYPGI